MGFKIWLNNNLNKIGDLYSEGVLMSFEQLVNKYGLPKKHFFKYLQVRSFITTQLKSTVKPPLSTIENITIIRVEACFPNFTTFYYFPQKKVVFLIYKHGKLEDFKFNKDICEKKKEIQRLASSKTAT